MNVVSGSQFGLELVFGNTLTHRCCGRHATGNGLYEIISVISTAPLLKR
jgi:hypothetical protein